MSTTGSERDRFLEELKSNYKKRIGEVDTFSKHFSSISGDFRSQCLLGIFDMLEYHIDLYKKFTTNLPDWYDGNFMIGQSRMITDIWAKTFQGFDRFYAQFADTVMKNMRLYNNGCIQLMQYVEKFYDMQEGIPQFSKSTMIEIIKEAKRANDTNLKRFLPEDNDTRKKKQTLEKKS